MRYIKVPEPIQLKNLVTGQPIPELDEATRKIGPSAAKSFYDHAFFAWLADPRGGRDYVQMASWMKVIEKFRDGKEHGKTLLALEDEQWKRLKEIAEAPQVFYGGQGQPNPLVDGQMLPFTKALLDASEEMPVEEAREVDAAAQ